MGKKMAIQELPGGSVGWGSGVVTTVAQVGSLPSLSGSSIQHCHEL